MELTPAWAIAGEEEPHEEPQAGREEEQSDSSSLVVEVDEADPVGVLFHCPHCNIYLNGPRQWEEHMSSSKHRKTWRRWAAVMLRVVWWWWRSATAVVVVVVWWWWRSATAVVVVVWWWWRSAIQ